MRILEKSEVLKYLKKRNLVKSYLKARTLIENDELSRVGFKKRKPTSEGVYQFRIIKKYRAFCIFQEKTLVVFEISDHQ